MGLIDGLRGKTVYLDTAPLIYFIEKHPLLFDAADKLFKAHFNGEFTFITSVLTLCEVLAQPAFKKRQDLADQYEEILVGSPNIELVDLGVKEAKRAAHLRSQFKLSLPDALHLSAALENKADVFFTNDKRITRTVPIEITLLSDV